MKEPALVTPERNPRSRDNLLSATFPNASHPGRASCQQNHSGHSTATPWDQGTGTIWILFLHMPARVLRKLK